MKQPPANIQLALQQVIDYLHEDERAHFQQCPPESRHGHIYFAVETLRQWLHCTRQESPPRR